MERRSEIWGVKFSQQPEEKHSPVRLFDDGGSACLSSQVTADRCAQEYNRVSDLNVALLTNSGGYKG